MLSTTALRGPILRMAEARHMSYTNPYLYKPSNVYDSDTAPIQTEDQIIFGLIK